jgi:hypothetical protein
MASWAAVPALSSFAWDGVAKAMAFGAKEGTYFWSNGDSWGTCRIEAGGKAAELVVLYGGLTLKSFRLGGLPSRSLKQARTLQAGESVRLVL